MQPASLPGSPIAALRTVFACLLAAAPCCFASLPSPDENESSHVDLLFPDRAEQLDAAELDKLDQHLAGMRSRGYCRVRLVSVTRNGWSGLGIDTWSLAGGWVATQRAYLREQLAARNLHKVHVAGAFKLVDEGGGRVDIPAIRVTLHAGMQLMPCKIYMDAPR